MSATLDELKAQCAELAGAERADLAYYLLQSLDDQVEEGVEIAWREEVRRRMERIRAGQVVGKPAAEVFAAVREKYA